MKLSRTKLSKMTQQNSEKCSTGCSDVAHFAEFYFAGCHYAECHRAERHNAEFRYA
jgi:hypothetical protein